MKKRYFSIKSIWVATYLGGPLAGGILMALNFRKFQQKDKAHWTLIISFVATVIFMWAIFQIPESIIAKVPNLLFPVLYTPIVALLADRMQKQEIQKLEEEDGEKEPWWKAAGLGALGTVLTLAVVFQLASSAPPFEGEKFLYGHMNHEIYYDGKDIDKSILNKVGFDLEKVGYFTDEFPQVIHLEEWESRYIISIYIDETYWEDKEILDELASLKHSLKMSLNKEITIKMLSPTFAKVKEKRI